ncbi:biopolymer transport protein TolR [Methylomarinovum caldicuralii]|uniref:Tol-Pal system protein TolR n=1 Tax=Methylomarinovum caldicuralii TaxID=438856 RepID=A0AAU9CE43_9GAMM|nr:protein TolR [Methylomarinovum caldicuralii]BCX81260.1 biopolymer transport protein TolR [Methylomarinovum caldicuralii]
MKSRTPRRRPLADINVVPYIDVTLVLLIIFMVTAPLLQNGVDVNLPQAAAKPVPPADTPPLIVTVGADGGFRVDLGGERETVDVKTLLAKVQAVRKYKPGTKILVAGDDKVAYGRVVQVMAVLQRAGVEQVGLLTRPPS